MNFQREDPKVSKSIVRV